MYFGFEYGIFSINRKSVKNTRIEIYEERKYREYQGKPVA